MPEERTCPVCFELMIGDEPTGAKLCSLCQEDRNNADAMAQHLHEASHDYEPYE